MARPRCLTTWSRFPANADDTIIEVAAVMARLRSPLLAVVKDGSLLRGHRIAPAWLRH